MLRVGGDCCGGWFDCDVVGGTSIYCFGFCTIRIK